MELALRRLMPLSNNRAARHKKPKGIANIGTKPRPVGIQAPLLKAASKITRTATTESPTKKINPNPRYFSAWEGASGRVLAVACLVFLDILLEYWLT